MLCHDVMTSWRHGCRREALEAERRAAAEEAEAKRAADLKERNEVSRGHSLAGFVGCRRMSSVSKVFSRLQCFLYFAPLPCAGPSLENVMSQTWATSIANIKLGASNRELLIVHQEDG